MESYEVIRISHQSNELPTEFGNAGTQVLATLAIEQLFFCFGGNTIAFVATLQKHQYVMVLVFRGVVSTKLQFKIKRI